MRLNVRNMVCNHCINALRAALVQSGFVVTDVGLGYAYIANDSLNASEIEIVRKSLTDIGFDLIDDENHQIIETVKHEVLRHVNSDDPCPHNLSHCIARSTGHDYKTVSRMFREIEGRTIEKFYVATKIEKVKELLSYGDITITEIAYRLGYSSVAFLSRQFKQETGMTLTQYQHSSHERRSQADI